MENTRDWKTILFGDPSKPKEWGKFWAFWTAGMVAYALLWVAFGY